MLKLDQLKAHTQTLEGSALDRIGLLGRTGNLLPLSIIKNGGALRTDPNSESQSDNTSDGTCSVKKIVVVS
jgi:hypothetical protein